MAKWYHIDGERGDLAAGTYNMDWFLEINMDVARLGNDEENSWCLRFYYALPQSEVEYMNTGYADYDIMKALYDKVLDWLQSADAPAVFHHEQVLDACFKEAEAG